jgi:hypothetical protein
MSQGEGSPPFQAPGGRARAVACVMWHAPDVVLRPELIAALQRPGFAVQRCADPYSAVAAVLTSSRAVAAGSGDLVVLVLVEPKHLKELAAAITAVQRAAPQIVMWMFEGQASPQLRAVRSEDIEGWLAASAGDSGGMGGVGSSQASRPFPPDVATGKLLTDEELSLLLDAEPKDE